MSDEKTPWMKAWNEIYDLSHCTPWRSTKEIVKEACESYAADLKAENERLKREKDNQYQVFKDITDDVFASIGDAQHVNENMNVGVRRVVAERDRLAAQLKHANEDAAVDDTQIRDLVKPILGEAKTFGDSYWVPGVVDLVEAIVESHTRLTAQVAQLTQTLNEMKQRS